MKNPFSPQIWGHHFRMKKALRLLLRGLALIGLTALAGAGFAQSVSVTPSPSSYSSSGGTITFTVTIDYTGTPSALGFSIVAPSGWTFGSSGGTNVPGVTPNQGDTGEFDFAWLTSPATSTSFTFTAICPAGLTANQDFSSPTANIRENGSSTPVTGADVILGLATAPTPTPTPVPTPISYVAPTITAQPASETVNTGANAAFWIVASGSAPLSYQWTFNGNAISGATGATLTLSNVTASQAGNYSVSVSNGGGSVTSSNATLTVSSSSAANPLSFASQPISQTAPSGGTVIFYAPALTSGSNSSSSTGISARATSTSSSVTYQWFLNNVPIAGATNSTYILSDATAADNGSYTCLASGPAGVIASSAATLNVVTTSDPGLLINISTRAAVGTGGNILIAGFVVRGSTSETVLIRGSGPALAALGVPSTLPDPKLSLYQNNTLLAVNTGWGGDPQIAAMAASVGAFGWGSSAPADSAILISLPPGNYTAQISGASGDTGVALVEVYSVH